MLYVTSSEREKLSGTKMTKAKAIEVRKKSMQDRSKRSNVTDAAVDKEEGTESDESKDNESESESHSKDGRDRNGSDSESSEDDQVKNKNGTSESESEGGNSEDDLKDEISREVVGRKRKR